MNIRDFLTKKNIRFETLHHERAFDAQHLAHAIHIPGAQVAKSVMLRVNGGYKYVAAILPATHEINLAKLSQAVGGSAVQLADEHELIARCRDCEAGVMPPFGSQYGLETLIDPSVIANEYIVFEGNGREEAIRMSYRDFYALEHPTVVEFAEPASAAGHRHPTGQAN
ncbi:MAG: YbaK/EbsC family protein [Planctomycetaceae bacterium]|nr:YbaK/EbsC family protein [Planctomycetaceae bacterium]